ncbi:MAG: hypothetical protein HC906_18680 [Bacteroidales bacterium]|nr:hypothetical protein [Bacteroidales bacterium]
MSGFILYILSLGGMAFFLRKAVAKFKKAKYMLAFLSVMISLMLFVVFNWNSAQKAYSNTFGFTLGELPEGSNNPMGQGIGVRPGRVVWAWDPNATNELCKNTITDAFFMSKNNNGLVVDQMMDNSIKNLAAAETVNAAWDSLFNNFNLRKTGTASGYQAGQTIFIKVNNGQAGWAINYDDLSEKGTRSAMTGLKNAAMANTTPVTVVSIIRQLVDSCNIPQNKIYVAEPMTHVYKSLYDAIHVKYPDVIVLDKDGFTDLGRKNQVDGPKMLFSTLTREMICPMQRAITL